MIRLTMESINHSSSGKPINVGLLATDGTLRSKLYQRRQSHKIKWLTLKIGEQKKLMTIIYKIKAGENYQNLKGKFKHLLCSLKKRGAEYIILGCTELSLFKDMFNQSLKLVDPIEILANKAIRYSKKKNYYERTNY